MVCSRRLRGSSDLAINKLHCGFYADITATSGPQEWALSLIRPLGVKMNRQGRNCERSGDLGATSGGAEGQPYGEMRGWKRQHQS